MEVYGYKSRNNKRRDQWNAWKRTCLGGEKENSLH